MAEAFGIVSGTIGIATAFTTCVDCFGYVQVGRHFGKDYQTELLLLGLLRLRLSRWGEAVQVYSDPYLGKPNATKAELTAAKDTVFQILVLLADSQKVSERYRLTAKIGEDLQPYSAQELDQALVTIENKMQAMAVKRQKRASLLKLSSWSLYSKEQFAKLNEDVTKLLDQLEALFPAPERQAILAKEEVETLKESQRSPGSEAILRTLQELSSAVDTTFQGRVEETMKAEGHFVGKIDSGDRAKIRQGDFISLAWKQWSGPLPQGGAVKVTSIRAGADAKIAVGNTYSGKDEDDFFD